MLSSDLRAQWDDPEWKKVAADMIEAGKVTIDGSSTKAQLRAASFIFDYGVFFLTKERQLQIADAFRRAITKVEQSEPTHE